MEENNIEIVEIIMQNKIAKFIKENRNMDKKELLEEIEKLMSKKEEMYNMNIEQLREELKNI